MNVANLLATKGGPVITIRPEQTVREAVTVIAKHGIGALVVVDETRRPIGIVTERHIIRRLAEDTAILSRAVGEIMTTNLVTATPQDELAAVIRMMTERGIRHVPIIDGGELAGIVSSGDVLRFQRDSYRGEADTLETRLLSPREQGQP
jgi:CBS domain-containing protein